MVPQEIHAWKAWDTERKLRNLRGAGRGRRFNLEFADAIDRGHRKRCIRRKWRKRQRARRRAARRRLGEQRLERAMHDLTAQVMSWL